MKPQPAKRETLLRRLARRLGLGKRRPEPSPPIPLAIEGNPTDKKTDPWGGPPPG